LTRQFQRFGQQAGSGFNPQSKKNEFSKSFSKPFQKNNRLKNQNNRLLHVFIAWREATQLDFAILGNILFLKVL